MPLHRRLPKRGFTNIFRKEYTIVNLTRLNELEGDTFDYARLKELGVVFSEIIVVQDPSEDGVRALYSQGRELCA